MTGRSSVPNDDPYYLSSLNKALDVLESFTTNDAEQSLAELSARLGLSKPSLHRILHNLTARDYVRRDEQTRRYRLGLRAWEVGIVAISALPWRTQIRSSLEDVVAITNEQATAWVYNEGTVVCIERVADESQRVQSRTRVGQNEPAHSLAAGRALLAFQAPSEVAAVVERFGLPKDFSDILQETRSKGYAVSRGERWKEIHAVAAPVLDANGNAVCAVSVSGPATRLTAQLLREHAVTVTSATKELSAQLGYVRDPR